MGVCGASEDKPRKKKDGKTAVEKVGESVAQAEGVKVEVKELVEDPINNVNHVLDNSKKMVESLNPLKNVANSGDIKFQNAHNEPINPQNPVQQSFKEQAITAEPAVYPDVGNGKNVNLRGQPQIGEEYKVSDLKTRKVGDVEFEFEHKKNICNNNMLKSCINNNSLTPAYCANKEREAKENNNIIKMSCIGFPEPDVKLDELETKPQEEANYN